MWWLLGVTLFTLIFLHVYFKEEMAWWEYFLPILVTLVSVFTINSLTDYFINRDTEFHGGWVVKAVWKEHWTERETTTETDDEGHSHTKISYTYHPDKYIIIDSNQYEISCDQPQYDELKVKFNNEQVKESHHLDQSSWGDGREFTTIWPGHEITFTPCFTEHSYRNKVAHSHSLFNFREITKKEKQQYHLYDYPPIYNYYQQTSLRGYVHPQAEQTLSKMNARLGATKQVRIFILIFYDQSLKAALSQQMYWKNGNKNELVVCIGADKQGEIQWVYPFCWDNERLKIDLREEIAGQKKLDKILDIIQIIYKNVIFKFNRKKFKDFEYVQVEAPFWAKTIAFVVVCGINFLIAWVVVSNDSRNLCNSYRPFSNPLPPYLKKKFRKG